jgi:hypothetical protein
MGCHTCPLPVRIQAGLKIRLMIYRGRRPDGNIIADPPPPANRPAGKAMPFADMLI